MKNRYKTKTTQQRAHTEERRGTLKQVNHDLTGSPHLHHLPECLVLDPVMCKLQGVRDGAHVERVGQLIQVPGQVIGRQVHTCDRLDLGFLQPVRTGHSVDAWLEKTILSVTCLCCIGYYKFIETELLE